MNSWFNRGGLALVVGLAIPGWGVSARAMTDADVRASGATGDGLTLDTPAIQKAIDACADAGGGRVLFPPGHYLSGTIRLRSGVTLQLEAEARLIGTSNLDLYSQPQPQEIMLESKWGKWHRALIVAENAHDIGITGLGVIDGNKVFDPACEERMRGPHASNIANCHGVTLRDVTIVDAANYAFFAQISDDLEFRNVKIIGGWDGIHWRGAPERWCHNVKIIGCQFYTGDDAIAGRYWSDTVIQDCLLNSSCNGIRLIGPATHLTIANNVFRGPGEQPHRSSGARRRTNMLAGIILQPGAWDGTRGPLDDVFIANNVIQDVGSPLTLWTKGENPVGKVVVSGLWATAVYRSAMSFESWADAPIENVELRDVHVEYSGGGKAAANGARVTSPNVDARALPVWGVYARNVKNLTLQDVRVTVATNDFRPVLNADRVERLELDNFKYTPVPGVTDPIVTNNVASLVNEP
jgi:polygalacturonase